MVLSGLLCMLSDQDMPAETEEPLPPVATPTIVGTEFSNISSDDVEELWRDHVTVLLRDKNVKLAVNTVFIVNKLFMVGFTLLYMDYND